MNNISFIASLMLFVFFNIVTVSPQQQNDSRYITLISEYTPMYGKVIDKKKDIESFRVIIQENGKNKEIVFHKTSENSIFFDLVKIGDEVCCKTYKGNPAVTIFKKITGGISVNVFYYKKNIEKENL